MCAGMHVNEHKIHQMGYNLLLLLLLLLLLSRQGFFVALEPVLDLILYTRLASNSLRFAVSAF